MIWTEKKIVMWKLYVCMYVLVTQAMKNLQTQMMYVFETALCQTKT